jgi:HEPN domain-containing protein
VNRIDLQKLAQARLDDASALLSAGRWSGAYYLAGYALECGLKACLLRYIGDSTAVFGSDGYLKELSKCWTHDLVFLVKFAGLEADFTTARGANSTLSVNWGVAKDWEELSRYEAKNESDAKTLYNAIADKPDGVFQWIVSHW